MRIHLDSCSLNRPWDDQGQIRIHREAESVLFLIEEARAGRIEIVTSDYLLQEILETADVKRRRKLMGMLDGGLIHVPAADSIAQRASSLEPHNIKGFDAQHRRPVQPTSSPQMTAS
jgi:hypothetical protein